MDYFAGSYLLTDEPIDEDYESVEWHPIEVDGFSIPAGPARTIFDYSGVDNWSVIAGVCRSWRRAMRQKLLYWAVGHKMAARPFAPAMFRRSVVRLHYLAANHYEMLSMNLVGDWDWRLLMRRRQTAWQAISFRLNHSARCLRPDQGSEAKEKGYKLAMGGTIKIVGHLMHHPPAALIALDEIIIELGKVRRNVYAIGSKYHRLLLQVDKNQHNFASQTVSHIIHPQSDVEDILPLITDEHRELIVVMIAMICDGIKCKDDMRKFIVDLMESTSITYPASAAAVARAISAMRHGN